MATGGRREEVDARIKAWERDLEKLRLALARAPQEVDARYAEAFVELYRKKEMVKSRWEEVRGVYRPAAEDVRQFEKALEDMEAAWTAARSMCAEVLGVETA